MQLKDSHLKHLAMVVAASALTVAAAPYAVDKHGHAVDYGHSFIFHNPSSREPNGLTMDGRIGAVRNDGYAHDFLDFAGLITDFTGYRRGIYRQWELTSAGWALATVRLVPSDILSLDYFSLSSGHVKIADNPLAVAFLQSQLGEVVK